MSARESAEQTCRGCTSCKFEIPPAILFFIGSALSVIKLLSKSLLGLQATTPTKHTFSWTEVALTIGSGQTKFAWLWLFYLCTLAFPLSRACLYLLQTNIVMMGTYSSIRKMDSWPDKSYVYTILTFARAVVE